MEFVSEGVCPHYPVWGNPGQHVEKLEWNSYTGMTSLEFDVITVIWFPFDFITIHIALIM